MNSWTRKLQQESRCLRAPSVFFGLFRVFLHPGVMKPMINLQWGWVYTTLFLLGWPCVNDSSGSQLGYQDFGAWLDLPEWSSQTCRCGAVDGIPVESSELASRGSQTVSWFICPICPRRTGTAGIPNNYELLRFIIPNYYELLRSIYIYINQIQSK